MLAVRLRQFFLVLFCVVLPGDAVMRISSKPPAEASKIATRARATAFMARQPLRFEPTDGGHDRFVARRGGAELALSADGATLKLGSAKSSKHATLSLTVPGHREVTPVVSDELPTKVTYARGANPAAWRTNVSTFARATYPSIVDGVDLVFHGEEGQVEYDFVVAPGVDASRAALAVGGIESLNTTPAGDLEMHTAHGTLIQHRPHAFQRGKDGVEQDVVASFRVTDAKTIGFELGAYDRSEALVIDPVVGYSTFLGSDQDETLNAIAADAQGFAYVVGSTFASGEEESDLPGATHLNADGTEDATEVEDTEVFAAKLDPTGVLLKVLYVGGSFEDDGNSIALDNGNGIYIAGTTFSSDFPLAGAGSSGTLQGESDAFLLKVAPSFDSLLLSTYIDTGSVDCFEQGEGDVGPPPPAPICTDENGYGVAVSGTTAFVVGEAGQDSDQGPPALGAFVTAIPLTAANTTPIYTQFFTTDSDGQASGVGVDSFGDVYITGETCDEALETLTGTAGVHSYQASLVGDCDAFLVELTPGATPATPVVRYASYLGGSGDASGSAISVTVEGQASITGWAQAFTLRGKGTLPQGDVVTLPPPATPFPTKNEFQEFSTDSQDAFVAQFSTDLTGDGSLVYSTAIGGSDTDSGWAIATDPRGNVYVAGDTSSTDFPTTPPNERGEDSDAFFVEIAPGAGPNGVLFALTYGGDGDDSAYGIAVNSLGLYATGVAGSPADGFLIQHATQPEFGGGNTDGFVVQLTVLPLTVSPTTVTVAQGSTQQFIPGGGSGTGYTFTVAGTAGGSIGATGLYQAGSQQGTDTVTVHDITGTTVTATVTVPAATVVPLAIAPAGVTLNPNDTQTFTATGGVGGYSFSLQTNASGGSIDSETGIYHAGSRGGVADVVKVTDESNATATATATIRGTNPLTITPPLASATTSGSVLFSANGGTAPYTFTFSSNGSGGSIGIGGNYVAGSRGPATDVVRVTDSTGETVTATVNVGGSIAISPSNASTTTRGTIQFAATGGTGSGYIWSATSGDITSTGFFTAPVSLGVVTVSVRDSSNNTASANVSVGGVLAISQAEPATFPLGTVQLTAFGGSGTYTWLDITNPPIVGGGSVNLQSGLFTAGPTPNVEETVQVSDADGNSASVVVKVGAGVSITPSTTTVAAKGKITFAAAGGSGEGYVYSITTNNSGGATVDANGVYTAGVNAGVDTVKLVDSVGNEADGAVTVTVQPPPANDGGVSSSSGGSSSPPVTTAPPVTSSSSSGNITAGGSGGSNDSCAVSNVGNASSNGTSLGLVAFGLLALARRRRARR